jgi:hypothetical protein
MPLLGREKVNKMTEDAYIRVNDNVRGVYLSGLTNIVQATPADTGRARNNWFLSLGVPSSDVTTSKAQGLAAIRQLSQMPKLVLNKQIFYTNNLPYIGVLEYGGFPVPGGDLTSGGFSKQAPDGWVRKTLIQMQNKIRSL